jgi:hypothetical protein
MRRILVLFVIMLSGACDRSAPPATLATPPSTAASDVTAASDAVPAQPPFTNRTWMRAGQMAAPGAMQIFLSDGTLVSDSCWETYRLSRWQTDPDGRLLWQEDGIDIRAAVVSVNSDELVLQMEFASGSEQHRYVAATVPYVCPDMPR